MKKSNISGKPNAGGSTIRAPKRKPKHAGLWSDPTGKATRRLPRKGYRSAR
jgi:hypothetical protein